MVFGMPHHKRNGGLLDSRGEVARLREELDALHATAVALALSDRADPDQLLERIVEHAAKLVEGSFGYVYLVDEQDGNLVQRSARARSRRSSTHASAPAPASAAASGRQDAPTSRTRTARRAIGATSEPPPPRLSWACPSRWRTG